MISPAIRISGLGKSYGSTRAVAGLGLEVASGEVFALLGANGAGKTTTVEILEGFRSRDTGDVQVLGTDPAHGDRMWRARVGAVLQECRDQPELTVRELMHHFAAFYPAPRNPKEVLDAVGLGPHATKRTRHLSGGQRRRLDVALAVVGRPDLLFLDEPTTGLDPQARRDFWNLVRAWQNEGTTIVLTTHYLDEAAELADRVGVMRAGTLVALGDPAGLGGAEARRPVVHWVEGATRRSQATDHPAALIAALAARTPDGEVPGLRVLRPSLEDVYLGLISEPAPGRQCAPTTPARGAA